MMKNQLEKNRKKRRAILGAAAAIILLNVVVSFAKSTMPLHIDFGEVNQSVDTYCASQGNYIAVCQENGLRQFPFVLGGRLSLLSLETGKFYTIKNDRSFLGGFVYPVLQGDAIYYFDGWDGSPQFLYVSDLKKKTKETLILEDVEDYAISGEQMFYTNGDDTVLLYSQNLKTGQRKALIQANGLAMPGYLHIEDENLYCCDSGNGVLYIMPLSMGQIKEYHIIDTPEDWIGAVKTLNNEELLIATGKSGIFKYNITSGEKSTVVELGDLSSAWGYRERYNFHLVKDNLYYHDKTYTLYKLNMKTSQKERLINWSQVENVREYINDTTNLAMDYFYCPDYIAVEVEYYDSEKDVYDHRVVSFDYDGKQVLNKRI